MEENVYGKGDGKEDNTQCYTQSEFPLTRLQGDGGGDISREASNISAEHH
jgi:hypothetical protein